MGWTMFAIACVAGGAAAWHFAAADLTLSHYDARAHLVVARRVIDSLTPGWRQVGAVWLPLPHLANMLPVQWDWNYRTGFSGVLLSILPWAMGIAALATYAYRRTASVVVAITGPLVLILNPNLLYLQSTPMTEPLLLGLSLMALATVDRWMGATASGSSSPQTHSATILAGLVLMALVLTRYEGWCIAAGFVVIAAGARGRSHPRLVLRLAMFPLAAIAAFLLLSRASTGAWTMGAEFFVPENPALRHPRVALNQVIEATSVLAGAPLLWAAVVGAVASLVAALRHSSDRWRPLLPLALVGAAVLPLVAFTAGHPLRVRYMVPLVAAAGALVAPALAWLPRRALVPLAAALLIGSAIARPPLDAGAPMVVEAQREQPHRDARRAVTARLAEAWDGEPILASMGSLGHYMQELAAAGIQIRDFVHEGNGDLWMAAVARPEPYVRWVLIEELAEGGDVLAARAKRDAAFLNGYSRIGEGGGVALYRRDR